MSVKMFVCLRCECCAVMPNINMEEKLYCNNCGAEFKLVLKEVRVEEEA